MIIPVNEKVAMDLAGTSLRFQQIWKELDHMIELYCQDNILLFEVRGDELLLDLPYKSRKNGMIKVLSMMNNAWYYDPSNLDEKVFDYLETESGVYALLKMGPKTTNLHPANWPR